MAAAWLAILACRIDFDPIRARDGGAGSGADDGGAMSLGLPCNAPVVVSHPGSGASSLSAVGDPDGVRAMWLAGASIMTGGATFGSGGALIPVGMMIGATTGTAVSLARVGGTLVFAFGDGIPGDGHAATIDDALMATGVVQSVSVSVLDGRGLAAGSSPQALVGAPSSGEPRSIVIDASGAEVGGFVDLGGPSAALDANVVALGTQWVAAANPGPGSSGCAVVEVGPTSMSGATQPVGACDNIAVATAGSAALVAWNDAGGRAAIATFDTGLPELGATIAFGNGATADQIRVAAAGGAYWIAYRHIEGLAAVSVGSGGTLGAEHGLGAVFGTSFDIVAVHDQPVAVVIDEAGDLTLTHLCD